MQVTITANPIIEALRYGTRCQGIAYFYMPPTSLYRNEMNHSFTDPGGMEGWVGLGAIMVMKQSDQDRKVTVIAAVGCLGVDLSGREPRH